MNNTDASVILLLCSCVLYLLFVFLVCVYMYVRMYVLVMYIRFSGMYVCCSGAEERLLPSSGV